MFENRIKDRITTKARTDVANTSDYINNPDDVVVRGVEGQASTELLADFGVKAKGWKWSLTGSGNYNFYMKDRGAAATLNTDKPQRVYKYQASISTTLRHDEGAMPWSLGAVAIMRGPVWYDTEENLLIPQGEPSSTYIHRKSPFWQVNLTGDVQVTPAITLFGAVNNLFNVNQHPLFIAIDNGKNIADLRFYNGSGGTSMPGRDFQFGLRGRF